MNRDFTLAVTLAALLSVVGCQSSPTAPAHAIPAQTDNVPTTTAALKLGHWIVQPPVVNALDGSKDQIVRLYANEANLRHSIELVLSFRNGKLVHAPLVGFRLDVDGFVSDSDGEVKWRFDDQKPGTDTWDVTSSHNALYPHYQNEWLKTLQQHKTFAIEFSYYEEAPQSVSFDLTGLTETLKAAGLGQ